MIETEVSEAGLFEHLGVNLEAVNGWRSEGLPSLPGGNYDLVITMCWVTGHRWSKLPAVSRLVTPTPAEKIAMGWLACPAAPGIRRADFFSLLDRCNGVGLESREMLVAIHAAMSASVEFRTK